MFPIKVITWSIDRKNLQCSCTCSDAFRMIHYFDIWRSFSIICYVNISYITQVLVVANPANTNALILKEFAPSIPAKNITCLTRLDHNRVMGQISERLKVHVSDVKNVIIWGNHSSTQYPDVNHATVTTSKGEKPVREAVADDNWWLKISSLFL